MNVFVKCATLVFLLSPMAWAQGQASALLGRACGPNGTKFAAHTGSPQSAPSEPLKSKARIVLFMETYSISSGCRYPVRVGMDGNWIGATCLRTYISADIDPGNHHLCADLQQKRSAKYTALYSFAAEAGKVYYFRAQMIDDPNFNLSDIIPMHLDPINEDEGLLLLSIRLPSESRVK
ncbi:MAG: hypothetical protein ACYCSN_13405 [Acidobacteriaceae bacterium]